jgi:hypothetical protein
MKVGQPPAAKKPRPPVRAGGKQSSDARAIVDTGETRGKAAGLKGKIGKALGSTGKGPPPSPRPPARLRVPLGPGLGAAGMLPGIAGPAPRPMPPLAIGERPQLGARTKAALRGRKR